MVNIQETVTRDDLRAFELLESKEYRLPSENAIDVLSAAKSQMKRREGKEFKMIRTGEPLTVRVTRIK